MLRRLRLLLLFFSCALIGSSGVHLHGSAPPSVSGEDGGGQEVMRRSVSVGLPALPRVVSSSCRVSEFGKKTKQKKNPKKTSESGWMDGGGEGGLAG